MSQPRYLGQGHGSILYHPLTSSLYHPWAHPLSHPRTDTLQHLDQTPKAASQSGRSVAVRNAAREAATVAAPESPYVARLVMFDGAWDTTSDMAVPVRRSPRFAGAWTALGRVGVGVAIVATGAWIAYTSMRGNAWFGHSLTPDPAAGIRSGAAWPIT